MAYTRPADRDRGPVNLAREPGLVTGKERSMTWSEQTREEASLRLKAYGLPRSGVEYWKFTSLQPLFSHYPQDTVANGRSAGVACQTVPDMDRTPSSRITAGEESDELDICTLSEAIGREESWAGTVFGELESGSHDHVPRQLAILNTMHAREGTCIRARGKTSKPVRIDYGQSPLEQLSWHRNLVMVDEHASVTMMETGYSSRNINRVLEVDIRDGGTFQHVQIQDFEQVDSGITYIFARLGKNSTFKSFTISTGRSLCRNECFISLQGNNGRAHVAGAAVGSDGFHHDDTIFITHDAYDCESRQVYKKVLDRGAVGVFQGKILVKPDAQKTDGYQISQALLMDETCQFLAKPELEIYADDVVCSHGSTCGSLDTEAMFYLRSRGIPKGEARDILALGFLNEALVEVGNEEISGQLSSLLSDWLLRNR